MRLLLIFKQKEKYPSPLQYQLCDVSRTTTYVIGQYLDGREQGIYHSHEESEMLFSAELEEEIQCISCDQIMSPIAVYRDYDFSDAKKLTGLCETNFYCIIKPRKTWPLIFLNRAKTDKTQ